MATKGPKLILFEWNFGYYDANKQDDDVIVNSSGRSSKLALLIISLAPQKKRGRVVIGTVLHTLPFLHAPVMTDVWR